MTAYEVLQAYLALKLHLTSDYDYLKYGGKLKAELVNKKLEDNFYRFGIKRIAKHLDPFNFVLANLLADTEFVPHKVQIEKELCQKTYLNWLKRTQSLTYLFSQELERLNPDFKTNFIFETGDTPYILCRYLEHEISIETMTILLDLSDAFGYSISKLRKDKNPLLSIMWLSKKYLPFLDYDREKFRALVLKKWGNSIDGCRKKEQTVAAK